MDYLSIFALFVLIVLVLSVVGALVALGMAPGRIAAERGHPQAAAINVAAWWGVITFGVLLPLAFIWAYYDPTAGGRAARPGSDPGKAGDDR